MSSVDVVCYLVIGATIHRSGYVKGSPSVRVTKNKPATDSNEIAIRLDLSLPVGLFQKPELCARVDIADTEAPRVISPEIQNNIVDAIRDASGLNVRLLIDSPAAPEGS